MSNNYVSAKDVRSTLGGVSNMTLHRWLADDRLAFPRPIYIRNRRYFDAGQVSAFKQKMAEASLSQH